MVEVYRTNVQFESDASRLKEELCKLFPNAFIHFDLEDCDRILKASAEFRTIEQIPERLSALGFECSPLED